MLAKLLEFVVAAQRECSAVEAVFATSPIGQSKHYIPTLRQPSTEAHAEVDSLEPTYATRSIGSSLNSSTDSSNTIRIRHSLELICCDRAKKRSR